MYEVVQKKKENALKASQEAELNLARRFGYLEESDEKGFFRIRQAESQRDYWDRKEELLKDRSKI